MRSSLKDRIEWIFVHRPTREDFEFIEKTFPLSEEMREMVRRPLLRPQLTLEGTLWYAALHVPVHDKKTQHTYSVEIDILATDERVATVAFAEVPTLTKFYGLLEKDLDERSAMLGKSAEKFLHGLCLKLLNFVDAELDHIQKKLDDVEERITIASSHRREMLEELALLRGDILDIRRIMRPEREVFEDLIKTGGNRWKHVLSEYDRLLSRIENHKEAIEALYDTFTVLVSVRASETMRILTIIATITLPLALFTSLFGMNVRYLPIVGIHYDFWIIFGIIAVSTLSMLAAFKKWRWF